MKIGMAVVAALALLFLSPGETPRITHDAPSYTPLQHGGGGSCGDYRCDPPEDCNSCPHDCGSCCGDGHCRPPEDCNSCPRDCGSC